MTEDDARAGTRSLAFQTGPDARIYCDLSGDQKLELIDAPQVGEDLTTYIHDDDKPAFMHNCHWVARQAGAQVTLHLQLRKGPEWWIAVDAKIVRQDHSNLLITLKLDETATAIIQATQLENLVEASEQGAVVIGSDGPCYVSLGYAKLLGYDSIEDLVGSASGQLGGNVHPDDLQMIGERIEARLRGEDVPNTYDFRQIRKDGSTLWVENRASKIIWDEQPASLSWISDITERKQAEIEKEKITHELNEARLIAERASQAKSEFLAMMSHEIRTPLNGVIGMAEVLKLSNLNDKQQSMAEVIESSGRSLLEILNNILDLSKLEAGHTEIHEDIMDLEDTLSTVLRTMSPVTDDLPITLGSEIADDVPESIVCDAGKLQQILNNFIGNAIKFTTEGKVTVQVSMDGTSSNMDRVRFEVMDTGIGINENVIQKLFNRFVQADSSTSRKFGGTGLGLAICKELSILMDGEVGCESIENQGSTFWISIPAKGVNLDTLQRASSG